MLLVRQTLGWRGRASRKTFYLCVGLMYAAGFLALPLQVLSLWLTESPLVWLADLLLFIAGAAIGLFFLGNAIRRLHDRNKSGWWLLVFFGPHVALATTLSRIPLTQQQLITTLLLVGMAVVAPFLVWGMVEIFLLRGVDGPNRYGPDPLDLAESPAPAITPSP